MTVPGPRVPSHDEHGRQFNPVLVDDVRAVFGLYRAGQRRRARRLMVRIAFRHDPLELEHLLDTASTNG